MPIQSGSSQLETVRGADSCLANMSIWMTLKFKSICSFERHLTVRFDSIPPQFCWRTPWGGQGPPTCLPLPSTSREVLRLDGYLE
ncbi:hypothetical protein TNCV_168441 [Trichonephila clavipes]|nr:hypothetical protein TNCV_168441 [Trichonephila clavipes]